MKLEIILCLLFLGAMFMGTGPGLRIINPDPEDPKAIFSIWNLPKIYIWGLFWYIIQLILILVAYFKIWTSNNRCDDKTIPSSNRGDRLNA